MSKVWLALAVLSLSFNQAFANPLPESCDIHSADANLIVQNTERQVFQELEALGLKLDMTTLYKRFRQTMSPEYALNLYFWMSVQTTSGIRLEIEETDISYLGELRYERKLPDGTPVRGRCTGVPENRARKLIVKNRNFDTIVLEITPAEYDLYPVTLFR